MFLNSRITVFALNGIRHSPVANAVWCSTCDKFYTVSLAYHKNQTKLKKWKKRKKEKCKPPLNLSRKHDDKKNFISRGLQSSKYGIHFTQFQTFPKNLWKESNFQPRGNIPKSESTVSERRVKCQCHWKGSLASELPGCNSGMRQSV